jgi:hypothetical protein
MPNETLQLAAIAAIELHDCSNVSKSLILSVAQKNGDNSVAG